MHLLSKPRARSDRRLDGRDLSEMDRRTWRDDCLPSQLVPGPLLAKVDDRPPGLCRRRQPGSDVHRRKGSGQGEKARACGLAYPRHLAGRVFSVVVHGDAAGAENLRRMLVDWMTDIGMIPSGHLALIDRYVE